MRDKGREKARDSLSILKNKIRIKKWLQKWIQIIIINSV